MSSWANDPELVATFRQEVEDRLASLCDGLLKLENHPQPRQLVAALFRDAHTVKGRRAMLGLEGVVEVAHLSEDCCALRSTAGSTRDVTSSTCCWRPPRAFGVACPVQPGRSPMTTWPGLSRRSTGARGAEPGRVPRLPSSRMTVRVTTGPAKTGESVRVPVRRVHGLLDVVGEAELEARRVERGVLELTGLTAEHVRIVRALRQVTATDVTVPPEVAENLHGLVALGDQFQAAVREMRGSMEDAQNRLAQVRDGAMGLAMVPVRRVVAAFPQLVREVAGSTDKDVRLRLVGEDIELDTRVLDGVADALRHLVTNAVDHGCDTPSERLAAGKPAQATVTVSARAAGSTIVIEVADDGYGIDEEALRLSAIERGLLTADSQVTGQPLLSVLFQPGFSTRDEVTSTSGRGVGLDVVRTAVEDLGGTVEIESELGVGTSFVMTLPVTLGVMRCLVARLGSERYAVPVTNVVETISLGDVDTSTVAGAPGAGASRFNDSAGRPGPRPWRARRTRDQGRRRRPLRQRLRAAGLGGRCPRGRARGRRQGPRRLPRSAAVHRWRHDRQRRQRDAAARRPRDGRRAVHAGVAFEAPTVPQAARVADPVVPGAPDDAPPGRARGRWWSRTRSAFASCSASSSRAPATTS